MDTAIVPNPAASNVTDMLSGLPANVGTILMNMPIAMQVVTKKGAEPLDKALHVELSAWILKWLADDVRTMLEFQQPGFGFIPTLKLMLKVLTSEKLSALLENISRSEITPATIIPPEGKTAWSIESGILTERKVAHDLPFKQGEYYKFAPDHYVCLPDTKARDLRFKIMRVVD